MCLSTNFVLCRINKKVPQFVQPHGINGLHQNFILPLEVQRPCHKLLSSYQRVGMSSQFYSIISESQPQRPQNTQSFFKVFSVSLCLRGQKLNFCPHRNWLQIRIQQRIHFLKILTDEEHRVKSINRLWDLRDGFDLERSEDDLAAKVTFP